MYQHKYRYLSQKTTDGPPSETINDLGEFEIENINDGNPFSPKIERLSSGGARAKILEYERRLTFLDKKCATLASEANMNAPIIRRQTTLLSTESPANRPEKEKVVQFDLEEKMREMNEEQQQINLANKIQSELEQEMKANLVYKQQQQITRMERKYDRKKKQNEERKRQR